MARRRLRDFLPKGLYWRTLLIIVAPAALLQLIITIVFLDDHWQATSKRMSQAVASDVALLIQLYEQSPTPQRFAELQRYAWQPLRLEIERLPGAGLEEARCRASGSVLDRYLTRALKEELAREVWYDSTCPGNQVKIRVPTQDGVWRVRAYRDRVQARSGPLFTMWVSGATVFLCIVSIIFIRNQVRPIEMLSAAMAKFGRGDEESGLYKARGAREVRAATIAFFDMRARIRRHIEQRTQLLAGVSHDLRTPLTRLKLQFAMMQATPEIEEAKRDVADMEETISEYLAFSKGQWAEDMAEADIAAIAEDVALAARRGGADIEFIGEGPMLALVRASALKRCIGNLVDNAAAHGERVRVSARTTSDAFLVEVEDNGPGIPDDLHEDAFRPFSRLDETRTKNAKGVGLGLAIARDVARAHGGDIVLAKSGDGGLKAILRLPRRA
ncbi:MAG: two-component sensor histidine kinase [Alphaproteobacteria bacterium]|nr:two-component sensor histidine kinase [Alphaproteobacteria bacterium]